MSEQNITSQSNGDGSMTVVLNGTLTIASSGELHRVLSEALHGTQRVELDLQRLEEIDLSAMQVICSACKSASKQKQTLVCLSGIPDCLAALGRNLGAPRELPCIQNGNDPCIWFGGVSQCQN